MSRAFDPTQLESLLPALDPMRDLERAGFRRPAPESALRGLPPDLQALWRWRDGQDRDRAMAETARGTHPMLLVQRFGITRRLRSQGRLLPVAEARALAVDGFIPVFETPIEVDGRPTYIGRCADGLLRYSFGDDDRDVFAGDPPGPRSEPGHGDLASWLASLEAARRAMYCEGLRPFEIAQRFVLALPGILGEAWTAEWDTFGMRSGHRHLRDAVWALHHDWGIDSTASATERLDALLSPEERPAWNLCRAVAVAGWAHRAGYLPLETAWGYAVRAARALQPLHSGWFSMAEAYLSGHDEQFGDSDDPIERQAREHLAALHALPCSPWNLIPWRTPLPAHLPPPNDPDVSDLFVVGTTDELHQALFDAPADSIIRLRAGRYRGCFQAREAGLTVEALPGAEAIFEPADGQKGAPVFIVAEGAMVLRGLTFVPSAVGVFQQHPYLRIEDCTFKGGAGDGIHIVPAQVDGEPVPSDFVLQIARTRFEQMKDGAVWTACGLILMEDVNIDLAYGNGLAITEAAELRARRTTIRNIGKSGIRAAKGGKVWLEGVTIEGVNQAGVALNGGAHELREVDIARARAGLLVDGGASALVWRSRLRDCAAANVELVNCGPVNIMSTSLEGGQWAGLWCHPGHGANHLDVAIGGSRLANVFIDGGRDVSMRLCRLGPSLEGGLLFAANGADVELIGAQGERAVAAGIEVAGSRVRLAGLSLKDVGGAALVAHSGGRLEASLVDLAKVRGDVAVWLTQGGFGSFETLQIDGVGPGEGPTRKGGRGLVVGEGSTALVQNLIVRDLGGQGPDVPDHERALALLVGERSRCAVARALAVGGEDDAIQVISGGLLAARELTVVGQSGYGILVSAGELRLEHSTLRGESALSLKEGAVATLVETGFERGAVRIEKGCTCERHGEWPEDRAGPIVALDTAAFEAWGVAPTIVHFAGLVALIAARRGFDDVHFRPDARQPLALVLEGAPDQVAALAAAVEHVMATPGALGVALAEVVHEQPEPEEESGEDEENEDENDGENEVENENEIDDDDEDEGDDEDE